MSPNYPHSLKMGSVDKRAGSSRGLVFLRYFSYLQ